MDNMTLVFGVSVAIVFALYMQIQKLTKNIDANAQYDEKFASTNQENTNLDVQKYKNFCDKIDEQIRHLRAIAEQSAINDKKDEFLQILSEISKKLTFVKTMNSSSNAQKWESELFELLSRIENAVSSSLKDADTINNKIRDGLQKEFAKL